MVKIPLLLLSQNAIDCARLTGQTIYTIEVFRPLRNIWNQVRDWLPQSVSAAGITWMSRFVYHYPRLMLMNLAPRQPATQGWPLYQWPPPHFLVGYQYMVRVCNDYIFDTRAFSRIRYTQIAGPHQQMVNWSVLANCTYTVNTGAYHRFIDLDNFEETLLQVQQAILTDRVVADMAIMQPAHLRGFGMINVDGQNMHPAQLAHLTQERHRHIGQCQDQAWGMADRIRLQQAGRKDLVILKTIRKLKNAYFRYLLNGQQQQHRRQQQGAMAGLGQPTQEREQETLSLPCDCDWLHAFVERFNSPSDEIASLVGSLPLQNIMNAVIDTLSLPNPFHVSMRGGAFELRPREGGRAVTAQMRRNRGEMVERFIDSLPIRRRRRRRPVPMDVSEEVVEEEEEAPAAPPRAFDQEVREAIAEAIRLLEEELTATARNQQFFNFAMQFYAVIQRLEALGDINEMTLRRWVMYFFVTEHIATTLNYLHFHLRNSAPFNRHVELNLAQLVMRARDDEGRIVYSRVWNEGGVNAFQTLMARITTDLTATIERAGHGMEEHDIDQFMSDIAYHDNSGDVQEILKQLEMSDTEIDSIELSFRFRVTGPVVFTQNRNIRELNHRVVQYATELRQERRELPPLNAANVQLPPLQR